ncbi:MAG: HAMP domain-containing histidine kinase [Proteobacteria bacterium]|nr:HAMP domain-containing histidine kinase [Pseudomonadota bacterium]
MSNVEFNARRQSYQRIGQGNQFIGTLQPGKVRVGAMQPVWIGERLLLVRFVSEGEKEYRQGVWLDWPFMRDELLASVHDKFPHAKLRPVEDDPHTSGERRLAVVPLEFLPGRTFITQTEPWSPLRTSLATAWSCVLLAALAVAALLFGVIRLSERRAAFVSAVTHELRTPLTTFRMYSEMLSAGMVSEDQRQEYLDTLRRESNRLSHLVENVLSYAKLERGRPRRRLSAVPVAELLAQAAPRLHERAEQAGMRMQIDVDEDAATVAALCDPSVVEQILFNLVDNACKYASNDLPAVIRIQAQCCGKRLSIYVRDQGPGIPADERRRLFQPFSKSASEAAHSKPGVGLGLALGRRLARAMGGDLRLEDCGGGAFVLILRCAS